jgi:SAM-dependent methyltransferase
MMAHPRHEVAASNVICPACHSTAPARCLAVPRVPVTCTSIFPSAEQAQDIPAGDIDLRVCTRCGLVFNAAFDPALGELGARYESSQAASAHFVAFADALADAWVLRHKLHGATVLEVGCGSGDFLQRLLAAGAARAIGVDPLAVATDPRLQMIAAQFDAVRHDFSAQALICRHTLEHVADVAGFLRQIRLWLGAARNRVALFELPDAERVFSEHAFWDVYYEHCNYFTERSLRVALQLAGLHVLRSARAYNDQYLLAEVAAAERPPDSLTTEATQAAATVATCQRFGREVMAAVEHCRQSLHQLAEHDGPVVLWQGAAKTVGLLAFLGDTRGIRCAVDLNPQRHNQFLPGTGLPVFAPQALRELQPKHVVLMNPVYMKEVRAALDTLGVTAQLHSVNDLLRIEKISSPC